MNPSSKHPNFLARHIRFLTRCLCHPAMAWIMFLHVAFYSLILVLGIDHYLDRSPRTVETYIGFHRDYLDSQNRMNEDLEEALAAMRECQ